MTMRSQGEKSGREVRARSQGEKSGREVRARSQGEKSGREVRQSAQRRDAGLTQMVMRTRVELVLSRVAKRPLDVARSQQARPNVKHEKAPFWRKICHSCPRDFRHMLCLRLSLKSAQEIELE